MINPLKKVEVNHITVRHPRAGAVHGMTIAHVTDIHHGRWVKSHHLRGVVSFVNAQSPHVVALTGDYVGYSKKDLNPCIEVLGEFEAPTYATLGNHDHWASTQVAQDAFAAIPAKLLENRAEAFTSRDGHACQVVGVDDSVTKHHDIDEAFKSTRNGIFKLTLAHVPALAPKLQAAGADLVLSGHTHGLQFDIPGVTRNIARGLGVTYVDGGYRLDDTLLYVSRGLGSASWPWRFRARPEITFLQLEEGEHGFKLEDKSITCIDPVD